MMSGLSVAFRDKSRRTVVSLSLLSGIVLLYTWFLAHIRLLAVLSAIVPWLERLPAGGTDTGIPYVSMCLFKNLTHLPCVFCGLTRSMCLLWQGHWQNSLDYHVLGIPFFTGALFFSTVGLAFPAAAFKTIRLLSRRPVVYGGIGLLILCWLWKLSHNPVFW